MNDAGAARENGLASLNARSGGEGKTVIRIPPGHMVLSPPQRRFLTSDQYLKLLNAGRGGGKDFCCLWDSIVRALILYEQRRRDPSWHRPGALVKVGFCAPNDQNFTELWQMMQTEIPDLPDRGGQRGRQVMQDEKVIYLFGKQGISFSLFLVYNIDTVRGNGFDICVVCEAALLKSETDINVISECVFRADHEGMMTIQSTPNNSFFDRWCDMTQKRTDAFWSMFEYHTWTKFHNLRLSRRNVEVTMSLAKSNPWLFRAEALAELFVVQPPASEIPGSKVWTPELLESCWVRTLADLGQGENPFETALFGVGIDLAWQGADELVITVIHIPTRLVCHIESHPKTSNAQIRMLFEKVYRQWNSPVIYYDRTGMMAKIFADQEVETLPFRRRVIPTILRSSTMQEIKAPNTFTREYLVKTLTNAWETKSLRWPHLQDFNFNCLPHATEQNQVEQFHRAYAQLKDFVEVITRDRDGREVVRYFSGRETGHDDHCWSHAIAARSLPVASARVEYDLSLLEDTFLRTWA